MVLQMHEENRKFDAVMQGIKLLQNSNEPEVQDHLVFHNDIDN